MDSSRSRLEARPLRLSPRVASFAAGTHQNAGEPVLPLSGDRVTVVMICDHDVELKPVVVDSLGVVNGKLAFLYNVTDLGSHWGYGTTEGAMWIHGWHAPDSEPVRAMLATFALVYRPRLFTEWE